MDGEIGPVGCGIHEVLDVLVLNLEGPAPTRPSGPMAWVREPSGGSTSSTAPARPPERGPPLRPRPAALRPLPRPRPAILLRLFPNRRGDAGGGAGAQEAPHRGQAALGPAGAGSAGDRLRLGRHGADPGTRLGRASHRHHLSVEQLEVARARAEEEGLAGPACASNCWTTATGTAPWTASLSVGMFEPVGLAHYRGFFRAVRRALKEDGVALVHAIGRADGPGSHQPLACQVHLPRRLLARRCLRCCRRWSGRALGHRRRDPARALRADHRALARPLRRQSGRHRQPVR